VFEIHTLTLNSVPTVALLKLLIDGLKVKSALVCACAGLMYAIELIRNAAINIIASAELNLLFIFPFSFSF
jgi:hypothetical protein